jgi:hypothetical protein
MSSAFETRQWLRQGDVISTLFFNVALEEIIRRVKQQKTGTIFNEQTYLLAYADDIVKAVKVELKINEQKTKYMIAAGKRTILDAGQLVAFGDKNFKVVNEFVYLRALVTPKNDVGSEILRRIQTANRCFCGLRKHLRSSQLARQTKIYKTLIRQVLLYDSGTCVLTKSKDNLLLRI